jgi:hypothetical protein
MSDVKCEACGNDVKVGERFAAIRAGEKWRVMHDPNSLPTLNSILNRAL